jgi:hypothetical protein
VTLAIFSRWSCFGSERDFYSYAIRHLQEAFPTLLHRERPHEMAGLRARLAARVALHNFCIWLNGRPGRPR